MLNALYEVRCSSELSGRSALNHAEDLALQALPGSDVVCGWLHSVYTYALDTRG